VAVSHAKSKASWRTGVAALIAYLVIFVGLTVAQPHIDVPAVPWWTRLVLPLLVYGLVVGRWLPRASVIGRLEGAALLGGLHAILASLSDVVSAAIGGAPYHSALSEAFGGAAPAIALQLAFLPLVAWPLRHRLGPNLRSRLIKAPARVAGPPARTGAVRAPAGRPTERSGLEMRGARHPAPMAPRTSVTRPVPPVSWACVPPVPVTSVAPSVEAAAPAAVVAELPVEAPAEPANGTGATSGHGPAGRPARDEGDALLRITFARVESQLPPAAFSRPVTALGDDLHEPGILLVPRRLVVPQLAEGRVHVAWGVVADQFPRSSKRLADAAIAAEIANGGLVLPLDEIFRQLPPALFAVQGPAPELARLDEFPLPFEPLPTRADAVAIPSEPGPALNGSAAPGLVAATAPSEPVVENGDARVAAASLADVPPSDVPPSGVPSSGVHPSGDLLPSFTMVPLHTVIGGGGTHLERLAAPSVPRDLLAGAVACVLPLFADGSAEQVTLRGPHPVVVTALGPMDGELRVLALAPSPGAIALAEGLSQRAVAAGGAAVTARAVAAATRGATDLDGSRGSRSATLILEPNIWLEPRPIGPRLDDIARALDAFADLQPSAFHDLKADVDLCLLRASGTAWDGLEGVSSVAYRALDIDDPIPELRRFSSMTLRMGPDRVFVHPVARAPRPLLLIVVGEVRHLGLAHLQLDRAVARLRRD
jgi:hypothetical protein